MTGDGTDLVFFSQWFQAGNDGYVDTCITAFFYIFAIMIVVSGPSVLNSLMLFS